MLGFIDIPEADEALLFILRKDWLRDASPERGRRPSFYPCCSLLSDDSGSLCSDSLLKCP
jgi:hypothetical protein